MSREPTHMPSAALELDIPNPPRFRWLKRGCIFIAALLAFLVLLRLWWGYEAQRRLDAEIARIRPILLEEYEPPDIPEEENAAVLYEEAIKIVSACPTGMPLNSFFSSLPLTQRETNTFAWWMTESHGPVYPVVREARSRHGVVWNAHVSQANTIGRTWRNDPSEVAATLRMAALLSATRGRDEEAIEYLRDLRALADAAAKYPSGPSTYPVLLAINELVANTAIDIAPVISLNGTPNASLLLAELLDERPLNEAFIRALRFEQIQIYEDFLTLSGTPNSLGSGFLGPARGFDVLRRINRIDTMIAGAAAGNLQAVYRMLPQSFNQSAAPALMRAARSATRNTSDTLLPLHFRTLAHRRAAAVCLAVRLYALSHDGQLPARLEDLAPSYIPILPPDPLRADVKTFGYSPSENPPFIYSVSTHAIDEGGKWEVFSTWPGGRMQRRWLNLDEPFLLKHLRSDEAKDNDSNGRRGRG